MNKKLEELRSKLALQFGKLTKFENEVCEQLGSLDAPAEQQIPIAEKILAERPPGVLQTYYESLKKKIRSGK